MHEIAIYPTQSSLLNNKMFCAEDDHDSRMAGFIELQSSLANQGWNLQTYDRANLDTTSAAIFYQVENQIDLMLQLLKRNPACSLFVFAIEPPVVCGMHEADILTRLDVDGIFTWRDDLIDGKKLIKANDPRAPYAGYADVPFEERELICTIAGNKSFHHTNGLYDARKSAIKALRTAGVDFHLFGTGWDICQDAEVSATYKGRVDDKLSTQSKYKFTLCFENACGYPGYVTEKIFDCFAAGSVPIYWGASNISDIIPPESFIDWRGFKTTEELVAYLNAISKKEFHTFQLAADRFMRSEFEQQFSGTALAEKVSNRLNELSRKNSVRRNPVLFLLKTVGVLLRSCLSKPHSRKLASIYHIMQALLRRQKIRT